MNAGDRSRLVEEIFGEAVACPDAASRDALIAERCEGDAALRAEVESLLEFAAGDDPFLDRPAIELPGSIAEGLSDHDDDRGVLEPGAVFGHYRILRTLGSGGMGVVYLAESDRPRRQVALKVIRAGGASRSILRRFEREAQVLAMLRHPGIAHIYETGAADAGRGLQPFFAMEFVEGPNLLDHAKSRGLSIPQRLELLAFVADAVQHAHDRGVIHRDLKPGNILVQPQETSRSDTRASTHDHGTTRTGSFQSHGSGTGTGVGEVGQPKVLDFGVARIVDPTGTTVTVVTSAGQLIGTLAYMSPEQVAGRADSVDARSDVYALGVLLYELLAGKPPIDVRDKPTPEAVRAIREDEPARLGSHDRSLRGDVETIAAKALEKDPARRYSSAGALAEDIRRYLRDEPIVARPPSTLYQARKFASRNRALVTGLTAAFVALGSGVIAVGVVASEAIRQRDIAREAVKAESLAKEAALTARERAELEADNAREITAFLNRVLLQAHPQQSGGKPVTILDALDSLGGAIDEKFADRPYTAASLHLTVGRLYGSQGREEPAESHFQKAFDLFTAQVGPSHRQTLNARFELGQTLDKRGRRDDCVRLMTEGLPLCEEALGANDALTCYFLSDLSRLAHLRGEMAESERLRREVIARHAAAGRNNVETRNAKAALARLLVDMDKSEEAEMIMAGVLEEAQGERSDPHPALIDAFGATARVAAGRRDFARAEPLFREAARISEELWGADHPMSLAYLDSVAGMLTEQKNFDEAEPIARRVLELRRARLGENDSATAASRNNLAWLLANSGRHEEAIPLYREAVRLNAIEYGEGNPQTFRGVNNLASSLNAVGELEEAEVLFERLVADAKKTMPEGHSSIARYIYNLGIVRSKLGKMDEAEAAFTEALKLARDAGDERQAAQIDRAIKGLGGGRPAN